MLKFKEYNRRSKLPKGFIKSKTQMRYDDLCLCYEGAFDLAFDGFWLLLYSSENVLLQWDSKHAIMSKRQMRVRCANLLRNRLIFLRIRGICHFEKYFLLTDFWFCHIQQKEIKCSAPITLNADATSIKSHTKPIWRLI